MDYDTPRYTDFVQNTNNLSCYTGKMDPIYGLPFIPDPTPETLAAVINAFTLFAIGYHNHIVATLPADRFMHIFVALQGDPEVCRGFELFFNCKTPRTAGDVRAAIYVKEYAIFDPHFRQFVTSFFQENPTCASAIELHARQRKKPVFLFVADLFKPSADSFIAWDAEKDGLIAEWRHIAKIGHAEPIGHEMWERELRSQRLKDRIWVVYFASAAVNTAAKRLDPAAIEFEPSIPRILECDALAT